MKKFRILMGALAFAVVAATVLSCEKEKEAITNINQNYRKPIAVYDNNSKLITTFIDAQAINEKLDERFIALKDDANRFVIESVEVLDSVPRNKDVAGEIKITILDTDDGYSYSIWCMKSFIVKDIKEQQVDYYLDDNVANGNFDVAFKVQNTYYIANFVGDSTSIHEVDSLDYGCHPWVLFNCRSIDCWGDCEKNGTALHAYCKQCPHPSGECNEDSILPSVIGVVSVVVFIFGII